MGGFWGRRGGSHLGGGKRVMEGGKCSFYHKKRVRSSLFINLGGGVFFKEGAFLFSSRSGGEMVR